MLIFINPFSFYGFVSIMVIFVIFLIIFKIYNFYNRKYTLESYNDNYYDSDDDGFENEVNYDSTDDDD
jgi:amino acid permease